MSDRKVVLKMDGSTGRVMEVITVVPQGSPVSPVLGIIYISELFSTVEECIENTRGPSFCG
jgi:hypothetical protein